MSCRTENYERQLWDELNSGLPDTYPNHLPGILHHERMQPLLLRLGG